MELDSESEDKEDLFGPENTFKNPVTGTPSPIDCDHNAYRLNILTLSKKKKKLCLSIDILIGDINRFNTY